jgi:hypothetical protein
VIRTMVNIDRQNRSRCRFITVTAPFWRHNAKHTSEKLLARICQKVSVACVLLMLRAGRFGSPFLFLAILC